MRAFFAHMPSHLAHRAHAVQFAAVVVTASPAILAGGRCESGSNPASVEDARYRLETTNLVAASGQGKDRLPGVLT